MSTAVRMNKVPRGAKILVGGFSAVMAYYCAPLIKSLFLGNTYEVGAGLRDPDANERLRVLLARVLERDREISELELEDASAKEAAAGEALQQALAAYEVAKEAKAVKMKKLADLPPAPIQPATAAPVEETATAVAASSGKSKN